MFHQDQQVEWLTNASEQEINDLVYLCQTVGIDVAEAIKKIAAYEIALHPYFNPEFIHEHEGMHVAFFDVARGWVTGMQTMPTKTEEPCTLHCSCVLRRPDQLAQPKEAIDCTISGKDRELVRRVAGFVCLMFDETTDVEQHGWTAHLSSCLRAAAEAFNVPLTEDERGEEKV